VLRTASDGTTVHVEPESVFLFSQNDCSDWAGLCTDGAKRADDGKQTTLTAIIENLTQTAAIGFTQSI